LRSQIVTSKEGRGGARYMPFCFTEQGVTMLSCVLNSERAIHVNIQIIRIYTRIREMLMAHKDVFIRVEQAEKQLLKHDQKIEVLFFTYLSKSLKRKNSQERKSALNEKVNNLHCTASRASKSSQLAALTSPCLFQPFRSPRCR